MIPKLREQYQVPLVNSIRGALSENPKGHFLVQLGTGGGKTYCFSYIAYYANSKGNRVFIGTDRTELLSQASSSIGQFGIDHTFINPGFRNINYEATTAIGMAQTVARRLKKDGWVDYLKSFDIYILDEAHKQIFNYLFTDGILDGKTVLGFTATPIRSGNMRSLGMDYDDIIQGVSIREMVEMGYLMPDKYYSVDSLDISKVPFNPMTGDLKSSAVYSMMNNREKYIGVVDNYRTIADKTKALTFCVNVSHAIKTCVEFNKAGIDSRFLVSNIMKPKKPTEDKSDAIRMKYDEDLEAYLTLKQYECYTGIRKDILSDYNKNKFTNLVNVDMLTTGYDQPDIETVIINRSTISQVLLSQMLGRASRPSPETGKIHFNILDMGAHLQREVHPLKGYMEPIEFGLWHDKSKGGGVMPTKECPKNKEDKRKTRGCGRLLSVSLKVCPFPDCGYEFPTKQQLKEVELKQIAYGNEVPENVLVSTMSPESLKAHAKLKGYLIGWVLRQLRMKLSDSEIYSQMKKWGHSSKYTYRMLSYIK